MKYMLRASIMLIGLFAALTHAITQVTLAEQFKLTSKILEEQRQYAVYLPPGYDGEDNQNMRYPVIYLLDGDNSRLKSFSGVAEALSGWTLDRQTEPAIIVALPNVDRVRDFTPTETDFVFKGRVLDEFEHSGGADSFADFIVQELIPVIEKRYRTNGKRTLVGQSFGGLFAAHVLLTRPQEFDQYLIIDGTFLWHDNYLNRTATDRLKGDTPLSAKVFVALANNDHLGEIGITNQAWGREFINRLRLHSPDTLSVAFNYFEDERHATVELMGWYQGLKYLFKRQQPSN